METFEGSGADGGQGEARESVKKLHACLDMISCYASMMSTLRQSPEWTSTLDLIQMMEELKDLLVDECYELQRILDEQIRPELGHRE